jgi:50S ribosomal subunit-associated GTPase HflX
MYALFFSLLLFFLLLFVMNKSDSLRENITNNEVSNTQYQPYSGNDPMILAQKNAANIQYLQEKLAELQKLEKNFNSLDSSVNENTTNIKKLAQYQANHITQATGISASGTLPPSISKLSSITNNPDNNVGK